MVTCSSSVCIHCNSLSPSQTQPLPQAVVLLSPKHCSIHSAWRKIVNHGLIRALWPLFQADRKPLTSRPQSQLMSALYISAIVYNGTPPCTILIHICYLHSSLPFSSRKGGVIISHKAAWFSIPRLLRNSAIPARGMHSAGFTRGTELHFESVLGTLASASLGDSLGIKEAAGRGWVTSQVICEVGACSKMETWLESLLSLRRDTLQLQGRN